MTTWKMMFCDWCRIAVPMNADDSAALEAFTLEHTHDEGWEQPCNQ